MKKRAACIDADNAKKYFKIITSELIFGVPLKNIEKCAKILITIGMEYIGKRIFKSRG